MEFRVTIDIFSGRKNPIVELKGREAAQFYDRLRPAGRVSSREMLPIPSSTLGYRGLIIEQSGARGLPKSFRVACGDLLGPEFLIVPPTKMSRNFLPAIRLSCGSCVWEKSSRRFC